MEEAGVWGEVIKEGPQWWGAVRTKGCVRATSEWPPSLGCKEPDCLSLPFPRPQTSITHDELAVEKSRSTWDRDR